jgi:Cu(I)/Ag(I) efflux system periplasmic protein CusF
MNALIKSILTIAVAMPPALASAQMGGHDSHHAMPSAGAAGGSVAAAAWTEGVVRKVDKDAKKITIKHGDLKNLGMPPMTMAFQVQDPSMVDKVKDGDKVRFVADQIGGTLTVTKLEVVK